MEEDKVPAQAPDEVVADETVEVTPDDETGNDKTADGESSATARETSAAWDDVISEVSKLGDALNTWAKSAAADPENRRRLEQVQAGMTEMADQAEKAFREVAESEQGTKVRQAADETGKVVGDTIQKAADAAAPTVAMVFANLADVFGKAATAVSESKPAEPKDADAAKVASDPTPSDGEARSEG